MTTLRIGIASFGQMRERSVAIAKGDYKPKRGEPKVWFTSVESFARVLSERNRELLALIAEAQPESLQELEALSGRKVSNLSRTLRKMEQYGIVSLKKGKQGRIKPRFPYSGFNLEIPNAASAKEDEKAAKAAE